MASAIEQYQVKEKPAALLSIPSLLLRAPPQTTGGVVQRCTGCAYGSRRIPPHGGAGRFSNRRDLPSRSADRRIETPVLHSVDERLQVAAPPRDQHPNPPRDQFCNGVGSHFFRTVRTPRLERAPILRLRGSVCLDGAAHLRLGCSSMSSTEPRNEPHFSKIGPTTRPSSASSPQPWPAVASRFLRTA